MEKIFLEQIAEIRFKPQSKVLDKRGEIANALISGSLNQWSITSNSIEIRDKSNKRIKGFFGFMNMGFESNYPVSNSDFLRLSKEHIQKGWHFIPLIDVVRIGVSTKILIPTNSFNNFFDAFKEKFLKLNENNISGFGGVLVDIALPLNFSDGLNQFNTMSGPVKKSEIEKYFEEGDKKIPEYGIYCQVDYFTTEIPARSKQKDVLEFIDKASEKTNQVATHIYTTLMQ